MPNQTMGYQSQCCLFWQNAALQDLRQAEIFPIPFSLCFLTDNTKEWPWDPLCIKWVFLPCGRGPSPTDKSISINASIQGSILGQTRVYYRWHIVQCNPSTLVLLAKPNCQLTAQPSCASKCPALPSEGHNHQYSLVR